MSEPLPFIGPLDTALLQRIKFRHLLCLNAIIETGSLQKAAQRMHVTESAASKTLKELESALGAPLFERSPRGMRATPQGEAFAAHALHAMQSLHLAATVARGGSTPLAATLKVAATPIAASTFLPPVVQAFTRLHPQARVALNVGSKSDVLQQLRKGDVDIAVGRLPPPAEMPGLTFEQVLMDLYVLAVRKGHPLARRRRPVLADLQGYPFLMPSRATAIWQEMWRFFVAAGFEPAGSQVEILDLNFSRQYVRRTDSIWVVSRYFLQSQALLDDLAILPVDTSMLEAPIGFIAPANVKAGTMVRQFKALIRKATTGAS